MQIEADVLRERECRLSSQIVSVGELSTGLMPV